MKTGIAKQNARHAPRSETGITGLEVIAYSIPTDFPESDGTLEWDKTTLVVVHASAAGERGTGYSYADLSTATLIADKLTQKVIGQEALDVPMLWKALTAAVRNLGRPGIASMAIAAVDCALWDLKARLLNVPLTALLGRARAAVPVYGSGGFTSYSDRQLQEQFSEWVRQGIGMVKMKVGRNPDRDPARVQAAREAIGTETQIFVDANGAYSRKQALQMAHAFAELGVRWFEEPVSSDDLSGLRLLRDAGPAGMDIAAGEYGYDGFYFRRMLEAGAVDVLQADATRCGGISGFLQAAALCEAFSIPLSAHTAPSLHGHLCCAVRPARHVEYFHDHLRIEQMLFDGALVAAQGELRPDPGRPGMGLTLKEKDAARFLIYRSPGR